MTLVYLNEHLNHVVPKEQVNGVAEMWRNGVSLPDIANYYNDEPDNIGLIIMHLAFHSRVKPREGGVYGWVD